MVFLRVNRKAQGGVEERENREAQGGARREGASGIGLSDELFDFFDF